jgi:peptidoglycan/xylan/chitin deacetylase (PgdA/CDA1 family)
LILISIESLKVYSNSEEQFKITYNNLLRVGDSTVIVIESATESLMDYRFRWKANLGFIDSSGSQVNYHAPDTVGEAFLNLEIYKGTNFQKKYSFSISIFNQLIILKADDLLYDHKRILSDNWNRFLHYVVSEKIKTSVGVVVNSLNTEDERYFGLLRYLNNTGYIELWNHGYEHLLGAQAEDGSPYDEFRYSSLDYQTNQLRKSQKLAKEKLGLTLRTFGAPGNAIDSTTILALNKFDEIKVWFFGLEGSEKLVLGRSKEMEYPIGKPDYQNFVRNFDSTRVYTVFQIHPNQWEEKEIEEFKKIIEYLKERHSNFILPYEYYNSVRRKEII